LLHYTNYLKFISEPSCFGFVAKFTDLKSVFQPSVTRNGTLYFISRKKEKPPVEFLIWRTEPINGEFPKLDLLPPGVNTLDAFVNWTPTIAPDESYLIFSSERGYKHGGGDPYISYRNQDGN
jgi:hypothetical protein